MRTSTLKRMALAGAMVMGLSGIGIVSQQNSADAATAQYVRAYNHAQNRLQIVHAQNRLQIVHAQNRLQIVHAQNRLWLGGAAHDGILLRA